MCAFADQAHLTCPFGKVEDFPPRELGTEGLRIAASMNVLEPRTRLRA